MIKKWCLLATALAFPLLMATNAPAYLAPFQLTDSNFDLSGPYAQLDISGSGNVATVTATSLNGYYFIDTSALSLNVNAPGSFSVEITGYKTLNGETVTFTPTLGPGQGGLGLYGKYNLTISERSASILVNDITFILTRNSGIWSSAADVLTLNNKNYLAAAHVKQLGGLGGFAAGDGTTAVPIPATAWLLGAGLLGLVVIRRRMKR